MGIVLLLRFAWRWLIAWADLVADCIWLPEYYRWTWPSLRELRESWRQGWYIETGRKEPATRLGWVWLHLTSGKWAVEWGVKGCDLLSAGRTYCDGYWYYLNLGALHLSVHY